MIPTIDQMKPSSTETIMAAIHPVAIVPGINLQYLRGVLSGVLTGEATVFVSRTDAIMWSFRLSPTQGPEVPLEIIEREFKSLAEEWHNETDYSPSPTRKISHDAYLKIIRMGIPAVPLILHDLRIHGGDWYTALCIITEESPVPADAEGDVELMDSAWFEWGRRNGYTF